VSQPDPTETPKNSRLHWTVASVALLVIGLLIVVPSGLCTALGLTYVISTQRGGDVSMAMMIVTMGGIPLAFGTALIFIGLKVRRRD
jgi:hypothetical protein